MSTHRLTRAIVAPMLLLTLLCAEAVADGFPVPDPKGTNITFAVGARRMAFTRANQLAVAQEGDFISANVRIDDALKASAEGKDVSFVGRLFGGTDKLLVEHTWTMKYTGSNPIYIDPLPNPRMAKWPHWTVRYAEALAKLPAGVHGLTYTVEMTVAGKTTPIARGVIKYTAKGGAGYEQALSMLAAKTGEKRAGGASEGGVEQGVELHLSHGTDAGAKPVESFEAGQPLFLHANFDKPIADAIDQNAPKTVYFILYLAKGGKDLGYYSFGIRIDHLHKERSAGTKGRMVVPVVSDPEGLCQTFNNNLFNSQLPKDLAKLPVGEHALEYRLECSHPLIADTPLAKGKVGFKMTDKGAKLLAANAEAARKASLKRGGEIIIQGLRLKSASGFRMVVNEGVINSTRGGGRFANDKFYIGLFRAGELFSDRYQPDGRTGAYGLRRADDGRYEVLLGEKVVATFDKHGKISDKAGKPWGEVYNEWSSINSPRDLRQLVAGLYHFSDLFR